MHEVYHVTRSNKINGLHVTKCARAGNVTIFVITFCHFVTFFVTFMSFLRVFVNI